MRPTTLTLAAAALLLLATPATSAEEPFDDAEIFFELNNTDGDLGIHASIDGEPWRDLEIENHRERMNLKIRAFGRMRRQGLTQLDFESAEPPFSELDPAAFFRRFPEGIWEISGTTIEGDELESEVLVSHVMAAPPANVTLSGVAAAPDCDADPLPAVGTPVVISWDPVTTSHPTIGKTGPVEVVRYQLVVEREEPTPLSISIELPPDVTSFEIPEDFTDLGEEFKFEILVREATGNQTAIESCFELE